VTKWKPPGAFDNVTSAHLDEVMRRLELADSRKDPRAAAYVGYLIAEVVTLDMEDPLHKKKVKKLLDAWIKNKALKVVMLPDKIRRCRSDRRGASGCRFPGPASTWSCAPRFRRQPWSAQRPWSAQP
jgi:hypothetical protein